MNKYQNTRNCHMKSSSIDDYKSPEETTTT